jgi:hypothetical protein
MRLFRLLFIGLTLSLSFARGLSAETPGQRQPIDASSHKVRVLVTLTMNDANESVFKQCLFRELRKIPEITVVEDKKDYNTYELRIVTVPSTAVAGYLLGFASSLVIDVPIDPTFANGILADIQNLDARSFALSYFSSASFYEAQYVLIDQSLDSLCKRIVAEFDTHELEQLRQSRQSNLRVR